MSNIVNYDIMWRQRISLEEKQLLNSYAGPKAFRILNKIALQKSQHFHSDPTKFYKSNQLFISTVFKNRDDMLGEYPTEQASTTTKLP